MGQTKIINCHKYYTKTCTSTRFLVSLTVALLALLLHSLRDWSLVVLLNVTVCGQCVFTCVLLKPKYFSNVIQYHLELRTKFV